MTDIYLGDEGGFRYGWTDAYHYLFSFLDCRCNPFFHTCLIRILFYYRDDAVYRLVFAVNKMMVVVPYVVFHGQKHNHCVVHQSASSLNFLYIALSFLGVPIHRILLRLPPFDVWRLC
jgi:hypothetical protein